MNPVKEQPQSKSKFKQELFECEGRVLRENITKSELKSISHALKLKQHALE